MANSLTFTSNSFISVVQFATASAATASGFQPSTNNIIYDIMGGTVSYDKRIYGINATNVFGTAETVTLYLFDGVSSKQLYQVSVAANSGNSTTAGSVDIFGNANGAGIFQKQKDANGVPYFNLPSGWSIRASYSAALTGSSVLILATFGETYQ